MPSYGLDFQRYIPFQESLDVDPGVIVQMQAENKVAAIDTSNGAVKASGTIASGGDLPWSVYGGVAMFKKKNTNTLVAYRLDNFSQAWEYKAATGATLDDFRPCGDKLVCVKIDASKDSVVALGHRRRQGPLDQADGFRAQLVCPGRQALHGLRRLHERAGARPARPGERQRPEDHRRRPAQQDCVCGRRRRVVMLTIRNSGTKSIPVVALVNVADGNVVGAADYTPDSSVYEASATSDTIALIDEENRTVYRFGIPTK